MRRHDKNRDQNRLRDPQLARVVDAIAADCDPSRLLELCYWSREPGLLEIMRAVAMMSEEARASLEVFMAMSREPGAIAANWEGAGRLTLTSSQLGQALAVIRYCADDNEARKPLLPN